MMIKISQKKIQEHN